MNDIQVKKVSVTSIGGGLSGIGNKNCYLLTVEYADATKFGYLLDCGQSIPGWDEDTTLGLDWNHVPNFSAIPNDVVIDAVVISHAHRDHDGGTNKLAEFLVESGKELPYFLMPQYAANMQQSREHRALAKKPNPLLDSRYTIASHHRLEIYDDHILIVDDKTEEVFGHPDADRENSVVFSFFKVNHSVADSLGVIIEVAGKKIIYSGDVRLHGANQRETFDFVRTLSDERLKSPDLLMLDATGADKKGPGKAEDIAIDSLLGIIDENPDRRVFATMFSSQPKLLEVLMTLGRKGVDRPVVIHGGSMQDNMKWGHGLRPLNYESYEDDEDATRRGYKEFVPGSWMRYSYGEFEVSPNAIIFLTGSQAEPLAALTRLLNPEYNQDMKDIHLTPNDIVVFAARTIPGNEPQVATVLEQLRGTGCTIYYPLGHDGNELPWVRKSVGPNITFKELHVSGHAPRDDLEQIIRMLKPAVLMPIHAPLEQRAMLGEIAGEIPVILPEDLEEVILVP
ncbi:MAG: hypothetical protein A3F94_00185 [Candidatus Spechtbacteria bacterium RIFCSPLOWO2_12_FULL_38_22]|uniref:Metallo-beta-lactamase domain-containing protein n=1 Tax=Candidatus Spechtbacteria bacterium RIFCSPLOWO2_12_FULL_38_22 TaxID=1802165 RepID=A0A1G2HGB0_9BACT|nr:MAG: hypothetical protein A3F94_00185 [Candidatus Spechtbacteria bacterium RIFCSPLOWO2_12_FULL_38_22]